MLPEALLGGNRLMRFRYLGCLLGNIVFSCHISWICGAGGVLVGGGLLLCIVGRMSG